ncbi:hypothetical protein PG996_001583 [Apiospora saccharicola]|uniref:NADH-ubiquinone oxidoreductase 21.3 kDa subunit n=1 Tax=Apiospora saccharicola TaxID=335842 RepID=A0ABR1WH32_9PEZI
MANPHPIIVLRPQEPFHPKNAVKSAVTGSMVGGAAGFFASAIQNSLAKTNVGAWGVVTRTGGTVAVMTAVPALYMFAKDASANLREKDDTWNTTIGAFLGGGVLGLKSGRMPQIVGWGAGMSIILSALEFTGGSLAGKRKTERSDIDEYERKEYLRKNRRRPLIETIAEVGEGRGIEPPGYEERRRERIQAKYGIEIDPVKATVDGSD